MSPRSRKPAHGLDAVDARHADVAQHRVDGVLRDLREQRVAAVGLEHGHDPMALEQRAQAGANQRLVVGETDAQRRIYRRTPARASCPLTAARWRRCAMRPRSLIETASVPLAAATRSRMPDRPLPSRIGARARPSSSMRDRQPRAVATQRDGQRRRLGVPRAVGQRFLHQPQHDLRDAGVGDLEVVVDRQVQLQRRQRRGERMQRGAQVEAVRSAQRLHDVADVLQQLGRQLPGRRELGAMRQRRVRGQQRAGSASWRSACGRRRRAARAPCAGVPRRARSRRSSARVASRSALTRISASRVSSAVLA